MCEVLQYIDCDIEIVGFLLEWKIKPALDELIDNTSGDDLCICSILRAVVEDPSGNCFLKAMVDKEQFPHLVNVCN